VRFKKSQFIIVIIIIMLTITFRTLVELSFCDSESKHKPRATEYTERSMTESVYRYAFTFSTVRCA